MRGLFMVCALGMPACTSGNPGKSAQDTGTVDSGGEDDTGQPPTSEGCTDAVVTLETKDGSVQDLTELFLKGDYLTLGMPGTLSFCPGTWYARILLRSDMAVVGLGDSASETVLSGGESGTILDIAGPNVTVTVENLTLDRGAGLDLEHNSGGGGIYCEQDGAVFVQDAIFTNNFANDGSAIYVTECTLDVSQTVFRDNESEDDGGAVTLWNSTATLDEVQMIDNVALDGGAMAIFSSEVTATNTTISGNDAGNFAGGVWVYESTIAFTDVEISNNTNDGVEYGGGLLVHGSATLDRVSFTDNSAPLGGGIFVYYDAVVEGTDCDFSGNTPEDIFAADDTTEGGVSYDAGSGYTFSCADNACEEN